MSNPILKLCSNQLPGTIFNSAVSSTGQLAIESRAKEITFFSVYNLKNGELISETQANISPWYSLAALDQTSLILRYFESQQNPDQVSFIRFDVDSNKLLNEVDIHTITRSVALIPELFVLESEGFQMVAQFLGKPIVLGCEYLELNELIIISYYLPFGKRFQRKLLVLKSGKKVLDEIQDKSLNGFAPGGFFTFQDQLIFINENTEIVIYEI